MRIARLNGYRLVNSSLGLLSSKGTSMKKLLCSSGTWIHVNLSSDQQQAAVVVLLMHQVPLRLCSVWQSVQMFRGCPCTTVEPKYRLPLIGTDGTATAEFTLFGRVARQIVVVLPPISNYETTDVSMPLKKTRLDRKTIPCKKTLSFGNSGCGGEETVLLNQNDRNKDKVIEESLSAQNVETSDMPTQAATIETSVAAAIQTRDAETILEASQNTGKNRSGGSRKKTAS